MTDRGIGHTILCGGLLLVAAAFAACGGPQAVREDASKTLREQQIDRAQAAKSAMMQKLMGELAAALQEGGPENAIGVCKVEAPRIAGQVAKRENLRIGRTSFKLRNPANVPPPWAADLVERRVDETVYRDLPGGTLGAFMPIHLKTPCATCHGPAEQIPPAVQKRLDELYPRDEATGFAPGDLRGWFWVEVPPST